MGRARAPNEGVAFDYVSGVASAGAPPKKKSLHAAERDTPRVQHARGTYQHELSTLAVRRCKCVDESGINLALTRRYGRAPRGERVGGRVPQNYGANVTLIGALGLSGLEAPMTVEGPLMARCAVPTCSASWGAP